MPFPTTKATFAVASGTNFEKGRSYQRRGAVRDLHADKGGQRLIADVQGTRRRPYRVFAEIKPGPRIQLSGQCSIFKIVQRRLVEILFGAMPRHCYLTGRLRTSERLRVRGRDVSPHHELFTGSAYNCPAVSRCPAGGYAAATAIWAKPA